MKENEHPLDSQNNLEKSFSLESLPGNNSNDNSQINSVADKNSALKQGLFVGALILVSSIFTLSLYCLLDNNQVRKTYQSGYTAGYDDGYNDGYDDGYGERSADNNSSKSEDKSASKNDDSDFLKFDAAISSTSYYVLNTSTKKIHKPSCAWADKISSKNYEESTQSISELENSGYTTCGHCF
jgi:hypothetical protein